MTHRRKTSGFMEQDTLFLHSFRQYSARKKINSVDGIRTHDPQSNIDDTVTYRTLDGSAFAVAHSTQLTERSRLVYHLPGSGHKQKVCILFPYVRKIRKRTGGKRIAKNCLNFQNVPGAI
jgi:hypothetical protein